MMFERKKYLDELIAGRGNGLVKIITGVRRCGKSFLLFDIWHNWLLEHGVTDNHIIEIQLDDFRNRRLRKPDALLDYIDSKVVDDGNPYYILKFPTPYFIGAFGLNCFTSAHKYWKLTLT